MADVCAYIYTFTITTTHNILHIYVPLHCLPLCSYRPHISTYITQTFSLWYKYLQSCEHKCEKINIAAKCKLTPAMTNKYIHIHIIHVFKIRIYYKNFSLYDSLQTHMHRKMEICNSTGSDLAMPNQPITGCQNFNEDISRFFSFIQKVSAISSGWYYGVHLVILCHDYCVYNNTVCTVDIMIYSPVQVTVSSKQLTSDCD